MTQKAEQHVLTYTGTQLRPRNLYYCSDQDLKKYQNIYVVLLV